MGSEVVDKVSAEGKFERGLWQKIGSLKANGTMESLHLIIRLGNQDLDKNQVEDLKRNTVSLLQNCHHATAYSTLDVLPVIMATVPSGEAERIASYTFVDSIGDGEQRGHFCLDISRPAIRADQVRTQLGFDGHGIRIAIIDTGVDVTHPDLDDLDDNPNTVDPKIIDSICFVDRNHDGAPDQAPDDYIGHGTMVAGIASGTGEASNHQYTGIAPGAWIMNLKIGYWIEETREPAFDQDDAIRGIDYAVSHGANVINLSFILSGDTDELCQLTMAVDDAVEHGVTAIVAAGNKPESIPSPANAFNAITVGAVDDKNTIDITNDELWSDSSEGPVGQGRPKPDVVAPGANITAPVAVPSDFWQYAPGNRVGNNYMWLPGTSLAAPHVSGIAALMLQVNPSLTPAQVKAILRQTARLNSHLDPLSVNQRGHGIVDALAAVQLAQNTNNIDRSQMYDSWSASTPGRNLGLWHYDYLTFKISPPSSQGISVEDIAYHEVFVIPVNDYRLLRQIYARFVWIDGTCYDLGNDMHKYLFSGPRIYEKGDGYFKMRAFYRIGSISIRYYWYMHVDAQDFGVQYSSGSSWKTLIYLDPEVWFANNFAFLPSTGETILVEKKIVDQPIDIRRNLNGQYVQLYPNNNGCVMWILKHGYVGNNPDDPEAFNYEYVYNRDIDVCYQATSSFAVVTMWRRTDQLPWPDTTQNDAGKGGDAGGSCGDATEITSGTYQGILCNSDPTDNDDYYMFLSGYLKNIDVTVTPPPNIDLDLQLYNVYGQLKATSSHGPGCTETISYYTTDGSGYYYARIYRVSGEGQYSFYLHAETGGTGGCPYVYVFNGESYAMDNNILPASNEINGTDVEDYYRLEQPLLSVCTHQGFSLYSLQIREFEQEHDYIDQAKLLAVDHAEGTNVAVTPEGEIITYRNPSSPVSCIDNHGVDRLSEISTMNGNVNDPSTYYQGYNCDWLVLNFGTVTAANAKLILRDDQKCADICINVQVLDDAGNWRTVEVLHPRDYWAVEAVNLTAYVPANGDFLVRLLWTATHRLDYVGLDTTSQDQFGLHQASPVLAIHSAYGNVLWKLLANDQVYAELVPGQQVQLAFILPSNQNQERTFILYTEGHYIKIT